MRESSRALLYIGSHLLYFSSTVKGKAKSKGKKPEVKPEQLAILDELKSAAEKLGIKVREERLLREVGYRVRSGRCRVGEDEVIFLDRNTPAESQIDVLIDELASRAVDQVYLSPAVRSLLDRAAAKEAHEDGEGDALGG
jgi:hypothetical protein